MINEWRLRGFDEKNEVLNALNPKKMKAELDEYRKVFGKEFGLVNLIEICKVKALSSIACQVGQIPEWFADEFGHEITEIVSCLRGLDYISTSIDRIAEAISEVSNEER